MFDLFRSRDKLVRIMLGAILIVVAASMVTYLIPNSGLDSTTGTDDTVLADVAGQKLTQRAFQQRFASQMQSMQGVTPQMAQLFFPQFLESQIQALAVDYEARKMGVTASDEEVLTGMMTAYQPFFQNGVVNRDQFEQYLASQGMTLEDITNQIRDQVIQRKLLDAVLEGIVVTPAEVEAEFSRRYDKARISYIGFPAGKFADEVKPTDDELRKVFEARKSEYPVPAKTSFQVVVVEQEKVAATMTLTDAQLRSAYSASMDNFRMPERIHVRHILVSTEGKSDAEKKAQKTKADDLLKQLKSGADFAELAKKSSDDKGSGEKGGDLDWIVKGQEVPEFDAAAFALKPKELSGVVTSNFGYHIIQVLDKEPAHVKPFDEVKTGLAEDLKKQELTDKVQMLGDQIRAALQKSPGSAPEVAKQYGATLVTVPEAVAGQPIPSLGLSPEIDGMLAQMKPNDVSPVLSLPGDRLAVVVLKARIPERLSDFDEVKDQVRQKYVLAKSELLAEEAAQQAVAMLRNGESMEKVAKSFKVEMVTSSFFGRADSVEGLGQAVYVDDAFTKPVGTVFGPTKINGRQVVSKILEKNTVEDPGALAAQRDQILLALKQKKATDRADLMADSVIERLIKEGKLKRNEKAITALRASYATK
jgi:peptidyl-prolyl cis-trans isomerase D